MSATLEEYQHWREHGGIFDLSARAKINLRGVDCVRYLNGQVTANVTKLRPRETIPACVTTAKGKLSAVVMITGGEQNIAVDTDPELREELLARLERYIVADDVVLEDHTDIFDLFHYVGPEAGGRAFNAAGAPGTALRVSRFGALGWEYLPVPVALGGSAFGPSFLAKAVAETGLRVLSPELIEAIRLEAAVPRWGSELNADTLPPEAGLDRTHIDYAKGCYIGQEVISRLKSVGHVNRQLCTFVAAGETALQAGWSVFAPGEPGKAIGQLTSVGWSFALAKPVALGYLRRGSPTGPLLAQPADQSLAPVEVTVRSEPIARPFSTP